MFRCKKSEILRAFRPFAMNGAAIAAMCTVATACTSTSYMGISLKPGAAPADVQRLAARAQAGDKYAQLELGERFEAGLGVLADRGRAIRLYRMAASDNNGTLWLYSAPGPGEFTGRVEAFDRGNKQQGLPLAKEKVRRMNGE